MATYVDRVMTLYDNLPDLIRKTQQHCEYWFIDDDMNPLYDMKPKQRY